MSANGRLDLGMVQLQVSFLKEVYADVFDDDDEAWLLSLASETDCFEFLRQAEHERKKTAALASALASYIAELKKQSFEDSEQRLARFRRREGAIRSTMLRMMEYANLPKAELPEATITVRSGVQKVIITDEQAIPREYCRTEPNKQKIRELLLNGNKIPGTELSNAEPALTIRTK